MASSSSKRASEAQDAGASKKQKQKQTPTFQMPSSSKDSLPFMFVRDLDRHITKEVNSNSLLTKKQLMFVEASFSKNWTEPYSQSQIEVFLAQQKHFAVMTQFFLDNQDCLSTLKPAQILKAAEQLVPLLQDEAVKSRTALENAVAYRIFFLLSFAIYSQPSKTMVEKAFSDFAPFMGQSADECVSFLAARSVQHLSHDEDRSVFWASSGKVAPVSSSSLQPLPTTTQPSANQPSTGNDAELESKAASYIQTIDQLKESGAIIPWEKIDSITEFQKRKLEIKCRAHRSSLLPSQASRVKGIILHGVQGAGKTEIARSWCMQVGGTFCKIDATIEGKYRGQTANLVRFLFRKVCDLALQGPVVVFFDEAEQLLGSSAEDEHMQRLQASIKDHFNQFMSCSGELYILAATNWPERIEITNFGRRFNEQWHVKVPGLEGRQGVLQSTINNKGEHVSAEDIAEVAAQLEGYTPDDIVRVVEEAVEMLHSELYEGHKWKEVKHNGHSALVAAGEEELGDFLFCPFEQLSDEDKARCVPSPLGQKDLLYIIDGTGQKFSKTYQEEEKVRHEAWSLAHGTKGAVSRLR